MDLRKTVAKKLKKSHQEFDLLIGFDGFVDEIIHVVDKRLDSDNIKRITTIDALGTRIRKASGLSTNIELLPLKQKLGGNGPIMTNALSKHNTKITYIGALGYPKIDSVFEKMDNNVTLHSIANNGHTDALEFDDGKLMLGKMDSLKDVTYKRLIDIYGKEAFIETLNSMDLFASVNWSMLPNNTDLWEQLITHILPNLQDRKNKPYFFIDLADPEKRENHEIKRALTLLKQFKSKFFVVLGLNEKEAYDLGIVLELIDEKSRKTISLETLNHKIINYLETDAVVIHPVDRSCVVTNKSYYLEKGPYIKTPRLTTGAGDNFNAGFMFGLLNGFTPQEALLTGMATSGFYVRKTYSPNTEELAQFLTDWANDSIE
ncbi:MAG: hypothetical protein K9L74_05190 [Candidatus Izimaplasma sp.]|nr:hypothetical protein [Candidatus Izimaplasma bacterium]